jgi:hypothetical protein
LFFFVLSFKMSGTVNKSSGHVGHSTTADLLSNPFGTGFPSTAAATAYPDSGCFVKTEVGGNQTNQLLLKPLASFHCYDNGHYQLFQHPAMDWQIHHHSSRWM